MIFVILVDRFLTIQKNILDYLFLHTVLFQFQTISIVKYKIEIQMQ